MMNSYLVASGTIDFYLQRARFTFT